MVKFINMLRKETLYSLEDVALIPAKISTVRHRSECNCRTESIEGTLETLPIIAAPMDSVVDDLNYKEFWRSGLSCIIPRTISLEKRLSLCNRVFCAFGISEIEENFIKHKKNLENLYILIDIANGHLDYQIELGKMLKKIYGNSLKLMGGNIANPETYISYSDAGFDFLRCGIGGGRGCLTGTNVSIYYPAASLLDEISRIKTKRCKVIADGGIRSYSDVIKCLALGADYVMMGYTLSKCLESSGQLYDGLNGKPISKEESLEMFEKGYSIKKEYHGMSTKVAQAKILNVDLNTNRHKLKTSEGRIEKVTIEYTLTGWVDNMTSYLKSAMSYTNSFDLEEFKKRSICQVISNSTINKLNK